MTQYPEIWNALAREFIPELVRSRPASGNRKVSYITARTAMNRLDAVLGFENWWDEYERDANGSDNIFCRLTIRLPDGRTLTKMDVGSPGSTGDDGEDDKGAVSDAFKRAAVKFGVGRYLYGEGVYTCPAATKPEPEAVADREPEPAPPPAVNGHTKERNKWGDPKPPVESPPPPPPPAPGRDQGQRSNGSSPPRSGRALFAWSKEYEQRHGVGLVKYLNGWAKLQEFPGRMVDWSEDQVSQGYAEAVRKLRSISGDHAEAYQEADA